MSITIDMRTGKQTDEITSGLVGYISWRRFETVLRKADEMRPTERLVAVQVEADGIKYKVNPA